MLDSGNNIRTGYSNDGPVPFIIKTYVTALHVKSMVKAFSLYGKLITNQGINESDIINIFLCQN
jgi:hypothetical protein